MITPPTQPVNGPGGSNLPCSSYVLNQYYPGSAQGYWIFEPTPAPESTPVIVFIHGYSATETYNYSHWLDHITRRGNIVVYPVYQLDNHTSSADIWNNMLEGVSDAFDELQNGTHGTPDFSRVAIVGHSAGGLMTANLAAYFADSGMPTPGAVMCCNPGLSSFMAFGALDHIPAQTLLLSVCGSDDGIVGDADALSIYSLTTSIPPENKNCLQVNSDYHGFPNLRAVHSACTDSSVNALDFFGYWKLFDGLCDAAFEGVNRSYALGGSWEQCFMGVWSDNTTVHSLTVRA